QVDDEADDAERYEPLERLDGDPLADAEHARVDQADAADEERHAEEVQDLAERPHPIVRGHELVERTGRQETRNRVYHVSFSLKTRSRPRLRRSSDTRRAAPRRSRATRARATLWQNASRTREPRCR